MTDTAKEQTDLKPAPRQAAQKPKRGKTIRRIVAVVLIAGLLAGGFLWWRGQNPAPAAAQDNLTEFAVARGNVTHTVSGPGAVSPVKLFTIATNLTGDILEDHFEEGDEVEKDALLFQLDGETTSLNFDAAKDTLSNARDSYLSALRNKEDLDTYTLQAGVISALYVKKGDNINSGGRVADIIDTGSMLLTLPFNSTDAERISTGDKAQVFLDDFG
ncbi:MAG: HlyD family efflux transporter periplasmic adaptor subunit, partial [Clostridiales bacterium]|nr:HlyD family efflux transporter periplasmic adaptor subunit [Clostridiales bacterium]